MLTCFQLKCSEDLLSGFVSEEALTELLSELRGRVRTKMTRRGKRKFKKESSNETGPTRQADNLVLLHSGILGLCSFVEGKTVDISWIFSLLTIQLSPMTYRSSCLQY